MNFEILQKKALKRITRRLKKLEKAHAKACSDLLRANSWETLYQKAQTLQCHYPALQKACLAKASALSLPAWDQEETYHYHLEPRKTAQQLLECFFKEAQKAKKGQKPLQNYVAYLGKELMLCKQLPAQLDSLEVLQTFLAPKTGSKKLKTVKPPYKLFTASTGEVIWVAKSGKKSEEMTFSLANGNDLWLHIADRAGAHVVIRSKNQIPSEIAFLEAGRLAILHSKAREEKVADIIFTQCKHLKRVPGKPGTVQVANSQRRTIRLS